MKKFILIDQSITDEGGHYLTYAKSVLQCAKNEGFIPILVTNSRFCPSNLTDYCLYERFTYTSLESLSSYRRSRMIGDKITVRYFWGHIMKPCIQRISRAVFGAHYSKMRDILFPKKVEMFESLEHRYKAECYMRELTNFFNDVQLSADDIVFIPTISYVELKGVEMALHSAKSKDLPSVHLLFRWSPILGRRDSYAEEIPNLSEIQMCFRSCQDLYDERRLRFYTDSDRLTKQFDILSGYKFKTLPIPHTKYQRVSCWKNSSIRTLTYLGDARPEKGFQFLPQIVKQLSEKKIHFQIQANYNIPGGEGGISACRRQLEKNCRVTLYKKPLNEYEYAFAIEKTDIMLILYNSTQYYARTSGIFAEAMSAGIPALIPADTWMSGEVCKGRYAWLRTVKSKYATSCIQVQIQGNKIQWTRQNKMTRQTILRLVVDWQHSGDSIRVEVRNLFKDGTEKSNLVKFIEKDEEHDCLLLIFVSEDCDHIELNLSGTYGQMLPKFLTAEIIELAPHTPPIGDICVLFDDYTQCAQLLEKMLKEYSILRESTEYFSKEWSNFHNAQTLIDLLTHEKF